MLFYSLLQTKAGSADVTVVAHTAKKVHYITHIINRQVLNTLREVKQETTFHHGAAFRVNSATLCWAARDAEPSQGRRRKVCFNDANNTLGFGSSVAMITLSIIGGG